MSTSYTDLHDACQHYVDVFGTDDEDGQHVKLAVVELKRVLDELYRDVPAQAEPRVWRDGEAQPADHPDVTDRYGNTWTWRTGYWFRANRQKGQAWWSLTKHVGPLSEVTDQAGETR